MNFRYPLARRLVRIAALALFCLFALFASSSARALTSNWNTDGSGNFTDPTKWDNGAPGSGDFAQFARGNGIAYSVGFPGGTFANPVSYGSNELLVGSNTISFFDNISPSHPQRAPYALGAHASSFGIVLGAATGTAVLNTTLLNLTCFGATLGFASGSDGTLNVNGGALNVTGFDSQGEELIVGDYTYGTLNINNGGHVNVSSNVDPNGSVCYLGYRFGSHGVVAVNGVGSTLAVSGPLWIGDLGSGLLSIAGGGQISDTNGFLGGYAVASSNDTVNVDGVGSTWTNANNLTIGFGTARGTLNISRGGQVTNTDGFIASNNSQFAVGSVFVNGAGSTWTNTGSSYVGNTGAGSLQVSAGGQVNQNVTYIGYKSSSAGTIIVEGAGSNISSGLVYVGANGNGSLNISDGGQVSDGSAYIASGAGSTGIVSVDGAGSTWTNAGQLSVGYAGSASLRITAGAQVSNKSGVIAEGANVLGIVTVDGAGSNWTIDGTLLVGGGFNSNATLSITGGGHIASSDYAIIGAQYGSLATATVDGNGSTLVPSGGLQLGAFGLGTLTVRNGGMVNSSNTLTVYALGTLKGDGTISGAVSNGGIIAPGSALGALHINGSYTQSPAGTLKIELAGLTPGTQFDRLLVSGATQVAGTLQVTLSGGFTPSVGNSFDILDWGTISGTFSTIQLPTLAGGYSWNTAQLYTTGVLSVLGPGVAGDYNQNGIVDAADYLVWRKYQGTNNLLANDPIGGMIGPAHFNQWRAHFGQTNGAGLAGDFNQNGVVNAADYVLWRKGLGTTYAQTDYDTWRAHFGQTAGSGTAALVAVPEPSSLVLILILTAKLTTHRRITNHTACRSEKRCRLCYLLDVA